MLLVVLLIRRPMRFDNYHEQCTKANHHDDNHDQIILNHPFLHGMHKYY